MNRLNLLIFVTITLGFASSTFAQEGVAINKSNSNPDASAILDVTSTEKGILVPRMTETQRNLIVSPANSLLIFQTTAPTGYYYYDAPSNSWLPMGSSVEKIDDLSDGSNGLGIDNVFLGNYAGASNQIGGDYNVGVGINTQSSLTTGSFNTSIGYNALKNTNTGSSNLAAGNNALIQNTTGSNNIALGVSSLSNNISGDDNVAVGRQAGFQSTGNKNVFLGHQAGFTETGSNKLHIGYTSIRSLIYGEFDNEILRVNGSFQVNDPSTTGYALPTTDGSNNQVLTTDGAGNVSWSESTDTDWSYNGSDIYNGNAGNVGIGTNTPNVSLDIDGGLALREFVSSNTSTPVSILAAGSIDRSFVTFDNYSSDFTINSIAAGTDGKILVLQNNTVYNMTIRNELISATAANRVRTMKNADIVSSGRATVTLIYSAAAERWVVLSEQDTDEWKTDGDDIYNNNSGNVGIGTSTPSYPLHLYVPPLSGANYGQYIDYNNYNSTTLAFGSSVRVSRSLSGGTTYGSYAYVDNDAGSGASYGLYGFATGTSAGMKCGVYGTTGGNGSKFAGYFAGNVFSTGSYLPSDEGLKKDVSDFENALMQLESIHVKEYEYMHEGDRAKMNLPKGRQIGIMAQNVEQVFPQLITANEFDLNMDPENKDKNQQENILHFKAVNYVGMIPVTIKAIQELKSKFDYQDQIIESQAAKTEKQTEQIRLLQENLKKQQQQIGLLMKKMKQD